MAKLTHDHKADLRLLAKVAPAAGTPIPAPAFLSIGQLFEVDRLASIGANLAQIGIKLHIPEAIWRSMIEHNPDIAQAYKEGLNRFQLDAMQVIHDKAMAGEPALLRLMADRGMLGQQWTPPKQNPTAVVITPGMAALQIDVLPSVEAAFAAQRKLIEGQSTEAETDPTPEDPAHGS